MIFLFTHPNCPNCGSAGAVVNAKHEVRRCASCNTVYGEFAVLSEGTEKEREPS
jgi:transposase-like protein